MIWQTIHLLLQISLPVNWTNDIPFITFIIGVCTIGVYGTKFGRYLWGRWIQWDDCRTDMRIKDTLGNYDKENLDSIIKDLCKKISDNTSHSQYDKVIQDISKLKGAVNALVGSEVV